MKLHQITQEQYEFFLQARLACRFHGDPEGPGHMKTLLKMWSEVIHEEADARRAAERKKEAA